MKDDAWAERSEEYTKGFDAGFRMGLDSGRKPTTLSQLAGIIGREPEGPLAVPGDWEDDVKLPEQELWNFPLPEPELTPDSEHVILPIVVED